MALTSKYFNLAKRQYLIKSTTTFLVSSFVFSNFFAINLLAQPTISTEKKSSAITIYNNNIGVVKETHKVKLEKGINQVNLVDVATGIEPQSVNVKIAAKLLEQNYQYDLASMYTILNKFIDKDITLYEKESQNETSGRLISIDGNGIVIKTNNQGITIIPNFSDYRIKVGQLPENLKTKPTLEWKILSEKKSEENLNLTYKTNGLTWEAKYIAVLNQDETSLNLNSWVNVTNSSGASFTNSNLKLVAGDVNTLNTPTYLLRKNYMMGAQATMAESDNNFEERGLMDFHVYELDRTVDLLNNEQKQISLFNSDNIKIDKKYNYNVSGNNQKGKANIIIEFVNNKENGLGIPLPKGTFSIYKEDKNSNELVGEDRIDHTTKDEKVKLNIGQSFDIVIDDVLISEKRISDKVYESEYKITVKNQKSNKINININQLWNTNWELISSNFKSNQDKASEIFFPLEVKAGENITLNYKIRKVY